MSILLAVFLLAQAFAACANDERPTAKLPQAVALPPATLSDSAGIRVTTYSSLGVPRTVLGSGAWLGAPGWGAVPVAFTIDTVPVIDFGVGDTDVELRDPFFSAAVPLPNGVFVVADGDRLLRVDSAGNLLKQAGRRGQGPSEFNGIESVCLVGSDTIVVIDKLRRVSTWTAALEHIQTRRLTGAVYSASCNRRGQFLIASGPVAARMPSDGSDSRVSYSLVDHHGTETSLPETLSGAQVAGTMLWIPRFAWTDDELIVADARRFEIAWRAPHGRVQRIVRLGKPEEKLSATEWQEFTARAVPRNSSDENRRMVLGLMGPTPNASLPPHSALRVDPAGRVWVADYRDQTHWTVFAHDGTLLGRVILRGLSGSPLIAVIQVGHDFIQIREPDEDGFTHLRFYRFRSKPK